MAPAFLAAMLSEARCSEAVAPWQKVYTLLRWGGIRAAPRAGHLEGLLLMLASQALVSQAGSLPLVSQAGSLPLTASTALPAPTGAADCHGRV